MAQKKNERENIVFKKIPAYQHRHPKAQAPTISEKEISISPLKKLLARDATNQGMTLLYPLLKGETKILKAYVMKIREGIRLKSISLMKYVYLLTDSAVVPQSTPLHSALSGDRTENLDLYFSEIDYLRDLGAISNPKYRNLLLRPNGFGNTPLHIVIRAGVLKNIERYVNELFKAKTCNVIAKEDYYRLLTDVNNIGQTLFHYAMKHGVMDNVTYLLKIFKSEFTPKEVFTHLQRKDHAGILPHCHSLHPNAVAINQFVEKEMNELQTLFLKNEAVSAPSPKEQEMPDVVAEGEVIPNIKDEILIDSPKQGSMAYSCRFYSLPPRPDDLPSISWDLSNVDDEILDEILIDSPKQGTMAYCCLFYSLPKRPEDLPSISWNLTMG